MKFTALLLTDTYIYIREMSKSEKMFSMLDKKNPNLISKTLETEVSKLFNADMFIGSVEGV